MDPTDGPPMGGCSLEAHQQSSTPLEHWTGQNSSKDVPQYQSFNAASFQRVQDAARREAAKSFLASADTYLLDSSSGDDAGDAGVEAHAHASERDAADVQVHANMHVQAGPSKHTKHSSNGSESEEASQSSALHQQGRKRKRKDIRSGSRASPSPSRHRKSPHKRNRHEKGSKGKKERSKHRSKKDGSSKHRSHRRGSSSSGSGSGSSDDEDKREREKILRLERNAAAAGIARGAAGVSLASLGVGGGAAGSVAQPYYYHTQRDLDNITYEALYAGAVPNFFRIDPHRLAKDARIQRMPGGVKDGSVNQNGTHGEALAAGRYWAARAAALERSKLLPRYSMRDRMHEDVAAAVLARPGQAAAAGGTTAPYPSSLSTGGGAGSSSGGKTAGYPSGSRLSLPLPAIITLRQKAAYMGSATAQPPTTSLPTAFGAAGSTAYARYSMPQPFAPFALNSHSCSGNQNSTTAGQPVMAGETTEQMLLRRTRMLAHATKERPQDARLWLCYAAVQDEVASLMGRATLRVRGVRGGEGEVLGRERKVAVLQAALQAIPEDERLLLELLRTYTSLPEARQLARDHPGAAWLQAEVARLHAGGALARGSSVKDAQAAAEDALYRISSERQRLVKEGEPISGRPLQYEEALVRLLLRAVWLDLHRSGHSELGVARLQAIIEWHLMSPLGTQGLANLPGAPSSIGAQHRLFDNFWESGAPRAGEDGAKGWEQWHRQQNAALWVQPLGQEGDDPRVTLQQAEEAEEERGGWGGWVELPPLPPSSQEKKNGLGADGKKSGEDEESQGEGGSEGGEGSGAEDEEASVPQEDQAPAETDWVALGVELDRQLEAMKAGGLTPDLLLAWAACEEQRSARTWAPIRPNQQASKDSTAMGEEEEAGDEEADDDALGVILPQDLRDCLFPLHHAHLVHALMRGLLALLGLPLPARSAAGPSALQLLPPEVQVACDAARAALLTPSCTPAPHTAVGSGGDGSGGLGNGSSSAVLNDPDVGPLLSIGTHTSPLAHPLKGLCVASAPAALRPWYAEHESRRAFAARLLQLLLSGPMPASQHPDLAEALLLVEASETAVDPGLDMDGQQLPATLAGFFGSSSGQQPIAGLGGGNAVPLRLGNMARARETAKALLAADRNCLPLWGALASVEAAAAGSSGQGTSKLRSARRILEAALAGVGFLPLSFQLHLPLIVLQYVRMELSGAGIAASTAAASGQMAASDSALADGDQRAYHVLLWFMSSGAAANNALACTSSNGSSSSSTAASSSSAAMPAPALTRAFTPWQAGSGGGGIMLADVQAARRGFERAAPMWLACQDGLLDAPSSTALFLGCLFEVVTYRLYPQCGGGLPTALSLHKNTTSGTSMSVLRGSAWREQLAERVGGLVAGEVAAGRAEGLPPARARAALQQMLALYPHNMPLMRHMTALQAATHGTMHMRTYFALRTAPIGTLTAGAPPWTRVMRHGSASSKAGRSSSSLIPYSPSEASWSAMGNGRGTTGNGGQPDEGCSTLPVVDALESRLAAWLVWLAAEAAGVGDAGARGPRSARAARVRALLERAKQDPQLSGCALVWMLYIRHELAAGRTAAAYRALVQAMAKCPADKQLLLEGLVLNGAATAAEAAATAAEAAATAAGISSSSAIAKECLEPGQAALLVQVAGKHGVRLRTEVVEVMLQHLGQSDLLAGLRG